jgi:isoquinoline 1-oxidoreductase alpha subunit
MSVVDLKVNGVSRRLEVAEGIPLLYVLRNDLGLSGPQFGCGLAQCGSCSVLLDGKEARACITPAADAAGMEITTLEGLPARWAKQQGRPATAGDEVPHPVQQAWIDEQVPMCGFCQNGMMIKATELLEQTPSPSVAQIRDAFMDGPSPHLCRCGTYVAILAAVQRAAAAMAKGKK